MKIKKIRKPRARSPKKKIGEIEPVLIEKGIPIPPPKGRKRQIPWQQMQVGDSFAIKILRTQATAYMKVGKRLTGFAFEYREEEEGLVRFWRVD